eukprot:EG_transcript_26611
MRTPPSSTGQSGDTVAVPIAQLRPFLTCPLCRGTLRSPAALPRAAVGGAMAVPCMHAFCLRCVAHITQTQTSCPLKCGLWWSAGAAPVARPVPHLAGMLALLNSGPLTMSSSSPAVPIPSRPSPDAVFGPTLPRYACVDVAEGTQQQLISAHDRFQSPETVKFVTAKTYATFFRTLLEIEQQAITADTELESCFFFQRLSPFDAEDTAPAESASWGPGCGCRSV